jgi:23S rRNA (adenine-N6)-dimethyltransferase
VGRPTARPSGRHHLRLPDAHALVAAAGIRPGDFVLDLGAGHGAMTEALRDAGARVLAVELDRRALAVLHDRFAGDDHVTVVDRDIGTLRFPHRPFRVVANLPFAITSITLRRLLDPRHGLTRADLVVQRGAAVAWASEPRRRTPLARRHFDLRLGPTVRAARFVPAPSVDAAVLTAIRTRR